jgi:hypothetical protein
MTLAQSSGGLRGERRYSPRLDLLSPVDDRLAVPRYSRLLPVVLTLGSILVGCGSGSPSVTLKYKVGDIERLYIQVRGSRGLVNAMRRSVLHARQSRILVTVVPAAHGKEDCSRTTRYVAEHKADPLLKKITGQRLTLVVYGDRGAGGVRGLGPTVSLFCSTPQLGLQLIP